MFEAFVIGPFTFKTHFIFLLIAIWASSEFFLRLAQSAGLSLQHFRERGFWHVGSFLLMGRLLAIIAEYRTYFHDPLRTLIVWDGNFSFLGGAIGIGLVLYFTRGTSRTTFLQWLDVLLPAACFGLTFDWLGKFAAGQAYGNPTDAFWGVTYDAPNVRFAVPIHPVQLYYAFFYLFLTFTLLIVRKNAKRAGAETLFGIIMACMAVLSFEFFRGDSDLRTVFATQLDLGMLLLLFGGLGVFAAFDIPLSNRVISLYGAIGTAVCAGYLFARNWLPIDMYELRFNQFLAILALLGTVVYVVVHRKRYPHL